MLDIIYLLNFKVHYTFLELSNICGMISSPLHFSNFLPYQLSWSDMRKQF